MTIGAHLVEPGSLLTLKLVNGVAGAKAQVIPPDVFIVTCACGGFFKNDKTYLCTLMTDSDMEVDENSDNFKRN